LNECNLSAILLEQSAHCVTMAAIKHLLLATVGLASPLLQQQHCVGCESGDQTALLQSHLSRKSEISTSDHHALSFPKISQLKDPRTRKAALIELQQTAVHFAHMDRSGVTDLVVQLCTDAAGMLNMTLYDTVLVEHNFDQSSLDSLLAKFDYYAANHSQLSDTMTNSLLAAQENVTLSRETLSQCRETQNTLCLDVLNCTEWIENECVCPVENHPLAETSKIWCKVDQTDNVVQDRYCNDNGVLVDEEHRTDAWRIATGEVFQTYSEALDEALALQDECGHVTEQCNNYTEKTVSKSTECNVLEQDFQVKSCDFRRTFLSDIDAYDASYLINTQNLADGNNAVLPREADRKVEWEVLNRVICLLLSLTHNKTDDDGNVIHGLLNQTESQDEIQGCWDMFVNVDHLDILYPQPPLQLGWPDLPPKPCTSEFFENQSLGDPESCDIANQDELGDVFKGTKYHCFCNIEGTNISSPMIISNFLLGDVLGNSDITAEQNQWSLFTSDNNKLCEGVITGESSAPSGSFGDLSQLVPQEEGSDSAVITKFVFAYPSAPEPSFCQDAYTTGLTRNQWFCCKGGFIFQDADGQVLNAYEMLPWYTTRPINTDSSVGEVLDLEFEAREFAALVPCANIGCELRDRPSVFSYGLGSDASNFCWTTTADGCFGGCLAWETSDPSQCHTVRLLRGIYDTPVVT